MVRRAGSPIEVLRGAPGLAHLRLRTAKPGLVLGRDQRGEHISLLLFRPAPTRVLMIGQPRLAKLLAMRALALGAALSLRSTQPAGWEQVLRCAEEVERAMSGDRVRPRLTIAENLAGDGGAGQDPWSTWLDCRPAVPQREPDLLAAADLVLTARLAPAQGSLLAGALGVTGQQAEVFTRMPADCVAVVDRQRAIPVRVGLTPIERSVIG